MSTIDWRQKARCQDYDSELFFPISHGLERQIQESAAKDICDRCPVVADCLTWALDQGEAFGVWGGKSEEERRFLGQKRRTTRKAPVAKAKCRNGHELNDPDAVVLNARGERCCVQCRLNRHGATVATGVAA